MFGGVDGPVALAHLGVKEEARAAVVVRHLQGLQWEVRGGDPLEGAPCSRFERAAVESTLPRGPTRINNTGLCPT